MLLRSVCGVHLRLLQRQLRDTRNVFRTCASKAAPENGEITPVEETLRQVTIKQASSLEPSSEPVSVKGWVRSCRKHSSIAFAHITDNFDRTFQVSFQAHKFDIPSMKLNVGSSVQCVGTIIASQGKSQATELDCDEINVIGDSPVELMPFDYKNKSTLTFSKLRQSIHMRPRDSKLASLLKIRSTIITSIYEYMKTHEYYNVTTPIVTSNDCEGAGEVFSVKSAHCTDKEPFFGKEAYLTVSAQLHLEAMACAMAKVFTLGPAFRAENSVGTRHLAEFTMLEAEECFVDLDGLMDRVEHLSKFIATEVVSQRPDDFECLLKANHNYKGYERIISSKFLRLTYDEAVELLNKIQKITPLEYGQDIGAFHEKALLDYFEGIPLFITHYPANLKAFYMKRDGDKALCFDLIARNAGEICGGSLREDDYVELQQRLTKMNKLDSLAWYLELRQVGNTPHGGFGLGLERIIQSITGIENVKDTIPFPRWVNHLPL